MAPEVLQKQPTTAASDVYAWAVTVNEIATGIFPFADCTKDNPQCQTVLNFGYGRSGLTSSQTSQQGLLIGLECCSLCYFKIPLCSLPLCMERI